MAERSPSRSTYPCIRLALYAASVSAANQYCYIRRLYGRFRSAGPRQHRAQRSADKCDYKSNANSRLNYSAARAPNIQSQRIETNQSDQIIGRASDEPNLISSVFSLPAAPSPPRPDDALLSSARFYCSACAHQTNSERICYLLRFTVFFYDPALYYFLGRHRRKRVFIIIFIKLRAECPTE